MAPRIATNPSANALGQIAYDRCYAARPDRRRGDALTWVRSNTKPAAWRPWIRIHPTDHRRRATPGAGRLQQWPTPGCYPRTRQRLSNSCPTSNWRIAGLANRHTIPCRASSRLVSGGHRRRRSRPVRRRPSRRTRSGASLVRLSGSDAALRLQPVARSAPPDAAPTTQLSPSSISSRRRSTSSGTPRSAAHPARPEPLASTCQPSTWHRSIASQEPAHRCRLADPRSHAIQLPAACCTGRAPRSGGNGHHHERSRTGRADLEAVEVTQVQLDHRQPDGGV